MLKLVACIRKVVVKNVIALYLSARERPQNDNAFITPDAVKQISSWFVNMCYVNSKTALYLNFMT